MCPYELFDIKTKTKTEITFTFMLLHQLKHVGQRRAEEKDDVTALSRILDGSKRLGILTMMQDLNLVSEYQGKHLNLFQII